MYTIPIGELNITRILLVSKTLINTDSSVITYTVFARNFKCSVLKIRVGILHVLVNYVLKTIACPLSAKVFEIFSVQTHRIFVIFKSAALALTCF